MLGFGPIGASAIGASFAVAAALAGVAPGAHLTGTGAIAPGSAIGMLPATAPGATLLGADSLAPGAASGNSVPGALPVNPAMFYEQPGIGWNFPDVVAGDVDTLSFSFEDEIPPGVTIVSASAGFAVHVGGDPDPNAMILAGPISAGVVVSVQVAPALPGVAYWPRVHATLSDGEIITLPRPGEGSLRVVA